MDINISVKRIGLMLLGLVAVFYIYKWLQPPKDDRQFLLQLPSYVASLAEKKQPGEIKKYIAKDYSDGQGRNYKDLADYVTMLTLRPGEISIYTAGSKVNLEMELFPPRAKLEFKAAMARGPRTSSALDFIPESLSIYDFRFELIKSDEGWVVQSGNWQPALVR